MPQTQDRIELAPGALQVGAPSSFRVSVTKDSFAFASAHFITFDGHRCEKLHGHNYRAGITLEGGLDPASWYVYDFVALKQLMRGLCDELDHRVLLPTENPLLQLEDADGLIRVWYRERLRYVFPRSDCVLLAIPNTTVEMLARHLAQRVRAALATAGATQLRWLEIEVEESVGQAAVYREELA